MSATPDTLEYWLELRERLSREWFESVRPDLWSEAQAIPAADRSTWLYHRLVSERPPDPPPRRWRR
jgi:hypothetical protein